MGEAPKRVRLSAEEEVDRYIATPAMSMSDNAQTFDLLLWWKKHACIFPGLSKVAKALLSIPPTSSPSERAFRAGRDQAPYTRNSLSDETLCMLIEAKSWYRGLQ